MTNFEPLFPVESFKKIRIPYKPAIKLRTSYMTKWKGTGYAFFGSLLLLKPDWDLAKSGLESIESKSEVNKNIINWFCVRDGKPVYLYYEYLHPRTKATVAMSINENNIPS